MRVFEDQEFSFGQVRGADNTFKRDSSRQLDRPTWGFLNQSRLEIEIRIANSIQLVLKPTGLAVSDSRWEGGRGLSPCSPWHPQDRLGTACDHEKVSVKL